MLLATGTGSAAWAEVSEADRALIAAAPDLFAELRETADWLDERAAVLREIVGRIGAIYTRKLVLTTGPGREMLDEAARFEGRATVIRQTILKATQGA